MKIQGQGLNKPLPISSHPEGKKGVNILKRRYQQIKDTLIKILQEQGEMEFKKLNGLAVEELAGKFDGEITWYVVSVKLDLEARGLIERVPNTSPHKLKLKNK
jgi:hypothetical protein